MQYLTVGKCTITKRRGRKKETLHDSLYKSVRGIKKTCDILTRKYGQQHSPFRHYPMVDKMLAPLGMIYPCMEL